MRRLDYPPSAFISIEPVPEQPPPPRPYVGRIAPTPSGKLHLGHAQTFYIAWARAKHRHGTLHLRIEDLDEKRCKDHFLKGILDDLAWMRISCDENNKLNRQAQRKQAYLKGWQLLYEKKLIYPSPHSRKDVERCIGAPHEGDTEVIFPTNLRQPIPEQISNPGRMNWRFRVPDNEVISFTDGNMGKQAFTAGVDFGDFLVWRADYTASYELAVVVDDVHMKITEVVRGCDLILSTARQILLYRAFEEAIPGWFHCPLVRDSQGKRMAKREGSEAMKELRRDYGSMEALKERKFKVSLEALEHLITR